MTITNKNLNYIVDQKNTVKCINYKDYIKSSNLTRIWFLFNVTFYFYCEYDMKYEVSLKYKVSLKNQVFMKNTLLIDNVLKR